MQFKSLFSTCANCGKQVTMLPSGKVLHNDTGRSSCSASFYADHIDHQDMMASIRGVTDH